MHIRTLGRLALEGSTFERQKPLLVLAYVAIRGKVARRRLAKLFWPEALDPRDSLVTTLRRLNKLGPGTIESDTAHVWTTAGCDAYDVEFRAASTAPETALDLYRGPFLDGQTVRVQEEIEEWIYSTRERLAELDRLTRRPGGWRRRASTSSTHHHGSGTRSPGCSHCWTRQVALGGAKWSH